MADLFPQHSAFVWEAEDFSETVDTVSFGRSWKFDFDAGDFVLTPTGRFAAADGKESWIQWCEKALRSPRYRHLIYSRNYGHEFEDLIGSGYDREMIESEVMRMAAEALMIDPRTDRVEQFQFDWERDRLRFSCSVTNIHDESQLLESEVTS